MRSIAACHLLQTRPLPVGQNQSLTTLQNPHQSTRSNLSLLAPDFVHANRERFFTRESTFYKIARSTNRRNPKNQIGKLQV